MSQSSPITLATGRLTRSGDTLTVELHQLADTPPAVLIHWPAATRVSTHTEGNRWGHQRACAPSGRGPNRTQEGVTNDKPRRRQRQRRFQVTKS